MPTKNDEIISTVKDLELTFKVLDIVYSEIREIQTKEAFFSFIATVVDYWASEHKMSSKETIEMMSNVAETMKTVHSALGLPKTSKA